MNTTLFGKVAVGVSIAALSLCACSGMSETKSAVSLLSTLFSHIYTPTATQKISDLMCSALRAGSSPRSDTCGLERSLDPL